MNKLKLNPPRVLALGFAFMIVLGGFLLNLPMASASGESIGFIDALFTSASAVCVTGLVVVNTSSHWSTFGKFIIITLIQIGGLGFMTMATVGALILGKKISLKERLVIKEQLNQDTMSGLVRLIKYVLLSTFLIEGIGAIILSLRFLPDYGLKKSLLYGGFHAISGFCNAGFDLLGNSMVDYSGDFIILSTISFLVILGGLGFNVYIDVLRTKNFSRLKLHSKVVLMVTLILILGGSLLFFLLEYNNPETLLNMSFKNKLLNSYFQSVITRTAGFNSVEVGGLRESSIFLMTILMFIGGSPASTGGGIKTTTFAVLAITSYSVVKSREDVVIFKKRIPREIIYRSIAIASIGLTILLIVSLALSVIEDESFILVLFEATSALATVGISAGLTGRLSPLGKIIIILTMYIGRLGPLTMAYAFGRKSKKANYRYSKGNIMVG